MTKKSALVVLVLGFVSSGCGEGAPPPVVAPPAGAEVVASASPPPGATASASASATTAPPGSASAPPPIASAAPQAAPADLVPKSGDMLADGARITIEANDRVIIDGPHGQESSFGANASPTASRSSSWPISRSR